MKRRDDPFSRRNRKKFKQWAAEHPGDAMVLGAAALFGGLGTFNFARSVIERIKARRAASGSH